MIGRLTCRPGNWNNRDERLNKKEYRLLCLSNKRLLSCSPICAQGFADPFFLPASIFSPECNGHCNATLAYTCSHKA